MKYLCMFMFLFHFGFGQSVEGYWKTINENGEEKSIVYIYTTADGTLEGTIQDIANPDHRDIRCVKCKGDKKDKLFIGLKIIENMKLDKKQWADGTITDPNTGKVYDCKIWLDKNNPNILNVRGYVGFFFKTQYWQRAEKT